MPAEKAAEDRVIEALAGKEAREQTREMFRAKLRRGELNDTMIEIEVQDSASPIGMFPMAPGMESQMQGLQDLFKGFGGRTTALAVNIEKMPTHIAGLPVAVNINCHVTRHKMEVL